LVVGGEIAVGLEDLACSQEAAVFEADVLHQGESLFDEGFVVPPPFGPGGDGFGESDGFAEMGEALLAERFGVGHDLWVKEQWEDSAGRFIPCEREHAVRLN